MIVLVQEAVIDGIPTRKIETLLAVPPAAGPTRLRRVGIPLAL